MNTITLVVQILLGLSLILTSIAASLRPHWLAALAGAVPQRRVARIGIALFTAVAALATGAGIAVPFAAFFASCLALLAALALAARMFVVKQLAAWPLPVWIAGAALLVAAAQPLGLKVLALPVAAELPFDPAISEIVKTYDAGVSLEGIAAASDGTLYLAANRDLSFSRSDYYANAQGELLARKPDGQETLLFKTPRGTTAGVPVVAADGSIYLTSHGVASAIWQIGANGVGKQVASFPRGAWPNGLELGPDGMLYTPDSALGVIWRVNPANGRTDAVVRDAALQARPYIALAPGANGVRFSERALYVTVSDGAIMLRYDMDAAGKFGPHTVVASGIPGDDFAIGRDGSLFITTHPYDTLVRVLPDGRSTIIGKAGQHIVGATAAAFGKGANDRDTLYVVTDGGAFTAGPSARGQLVALKPYARP